MELRGKDAATVINVIDKVSWHRPFTSATTTHIAYLSIRPKALKDDRVPDKTRSHAFKLLRKLAGASRQVPKSYLIDKSTRYKVKNEVYARGGFADIREGRLGKKVVAVKTLQKSQETKVDTLHKVRKARCLILVN